MSDSRKLGPNVKRLMARKVARDAIPVGGGVSDAMAIFTEPGRLIDLSRNALLWIDEAIAVIKSAPDNPYGDDEEAIAGAILAMLEGKEGTAP